MSQLFDTSPPPGTPGSPGTPEHFAQVALERGIDAMAEGLTYAVPPQLADLAVGDRVVVPLGRGDKPASGYVVELLSRAAVPPQRLGRIKAIAARDPRSIALTPDLIQLARWMAGYYCCPLGMVLATMLPAPVRHGTGSVTRIVVALPSPPPPLPLGEGRGEGRSAAPPQPLDPGKPRRLTPMQQAVLDAAGRLRGEGQPWVLMKDLADHAGARSIAPVKQLVARGLLTSAKQSGIQPPVAIAQDPAGGPNAAPAVTLNSAQQQAVERLAASIGAGFSVHLLHGVTGSGKTEVYLRMIEHALGGVAGGGAIVLVPEIALTSQTVSRFVARFAHLGVAVLHSGLTAAQRHEQWQMVRAGKARVVVGARSAVFAPIPFAPAEQSGGMAVGVIIVDEEHESSYKQDQLPRYHARDAAIKRGQILGIPVVLGSATPSLESYYNATHVDAPPAPSDPGVSRTQPRACADSARPEAGPRASAIATRYHLLRLPERVANLKLPKVEIVDLREERRKRYQTTGSAGVHLLSLRLETALRQTLEAHGQVILLLNRRGYANFIACPDHRCGWMKTCDYCDATMVYHRMEHLRTGGMVQCHHCNAEQLLPALCPICHRKVTVFGLGTQRVEEELARKFPAAKLARMDADSMRTARDYQETLARFRAGDVDVLLGTQMIAKGLDFPNVRLVGVISADTALNLPDFRAAERTFQLIAQVAGRTGRGEHPGLVIVQSFSPQDSAIVLASKHDYETFAHNEIKLRQAVGLPPVTRMARIVIRDRDPVACHKRARELADHLTQFDAQLQTQVRLRGPAPCPVARIAGYHRHQIELIAPHAAAMQKLLTALRNSRLLHSDAHTAVDVDPVMLM
jgi:primosomal protein N' (replication factor Y)